MAPLLARIALTAAAAAAVRAGVAIALAERERRARLARLRRERSFALLAGERSGDGLRRMALGQLDLAIELVSAQNGTVSAGEAVHEVRKALKRVRALLALCEEHLGATVVEREREALREAGRRIAGARDARVLASTLDELLRRDDSALARRRGVIELRAALLAESERAEAALGAGVRPALLADLRQVRAGVAAWQLPGGGLQPYLSGLERVYARGRRRFRRARRDRGKRAVLMHRWRKRVKDLRHVAEALSRCDPGLRERATLVSRPRDRRERTAQRHAGEQLRRLARRADTLGEVLGAEHDLVVLDALLGAELACGRRGGRKALRKLVRSRRRRLRAEALRRGARLYARKPRKLARALAQK